MTLALRHQSHVGPFVMGCAGVRYLMRLHVRNVSNDRDAQDCNESEATNLKAGEFATQTKSIRGGDLAPNVGFGKFWCFSVWNLSRSPNFLSPKAGPTIRSRHMAPRPTGEPALVHLRTRLLRHEVLGGFSMVVSNHHVNVNPRHAALGP